MNGSSSFLYKVFLNTKPNMKATNIPNMYKDATTIDALSGKNNPANITYTGSLALHDINGAKRAVSFLSFSLSKVLADIIAGTVHPNPVIIGRKAFPESPIFLMNLSIKKATLAIYPLSSNIAIHKNKANIIGNKTIIPPTPATIPSTSNDWNHGAVPDNRSLKYGMKVSPKNPSKASEIGCPTHENVNWNTKYISAINNGYASHGFKNTLSNLSVKVVEELPDLLKQSDNLSSINL